MERRLVRVGGHHLHLRLWGGGAAPPLLLLHWTPLSGAMWAPVAPRLAAAGGRQVLAPDLLGYGQSDARPEGWTVAGWADQQAALLDEAGVEAAHVLGGHMGAAVAAELALRHPGRVRSLVLDGVPLLNAALRAAFAGLAAQRWPAAADAPGWAAARALGLMGEYRPGWRLTEPEVPAFLAIQRDLLAAGIASSAPVALTQDLAATLAGVAPPVLLVGASADPLAPQFQAAGALLPRAARLWLEGWHPLHAGDPRGVWTGPVADFLRTIDRGETAAPGG